MAGDHKDYGSVEKAEGNKAAVPKPVAKAKLSVNDKVTPVVFLTVMLVCCFVAAAMSKAEHQMDQDLYAFEEDDFDHKDIVWNGQRWVDEASGAPMIMKQRQGPTTLLQKAQTQLLVDVTKPSSPNYNCCYIPKQGAHNGGVHVAGTDKLVESGMFCHMAMKGKPSTEWPMIRMGSLREAGVTVDEGQGAGMLASHQLHHCKNDLIFKSQKVAVLASAATQKLDLY